MEEGLVLLQEIAKQVYKKIPKTHYIEKEDLIAWGFFGLSKALIKFDPLLAPNFENYARIKIYGAMMDGLGQTGFSERSSRGGSLKRGIKINYLQDCSLEAWKLESEDSPKNLEDFEVLKEAIQILPPLQQIIIRYYFWEDQKMSSIGEKLGRTQPNISDILFESLKQIKIFIESKNNAR